MPSPPSAEGLSADERAFAAQAIRRKHVFRTLAIVGVLIGVGLLLLALYERVAHPDRATGAHLVVVVLVLLNARQNLRQHKYAALLEKLTRA